MKRSPQKNQRINLPLFLEKSPHALTNQYEVPLGGPFPSNIIIVSVYVLFYLIFSSLASAWLKQNGDAILEFLCPTSKKAPSAQSLTSTQMTSNNVATFKANLFQTLAKYISNLKNLIFPGEYVNL